MNKEIDRKEPRHAMYAGYIKMVYFYFGCLYMDQNNKPNIDAVPLWIYQLRVTSFPTTEPGYTSLRIHC